MDEVSVSTRHGIELMTRIPFDLEVYRNQMRTFISGRPYEQVFWDALDFATEAHDDQWRRSGDAVLCRRMYCQ